MKTPAGTAKLNQKGFTLVEVLVSLAILVVIFTLLAYVLSNHIRTVASGGQHTRAMYTAKQQVDDQLLAPVATPSPTTLRMTLTDRTGNHVTASASGHIVDGWDADGNTHIKTFEAGELGQ